MEQAVNIVQHHNNTDHAAENIVSKAGCHQLLELILTSLKSMYLMEGRAFMHNEQDYIKNIQSHNPNRAL
jgi:hypothetical protein